MEPVQGTREHLESYVAALRTGWSADNVRGPVAAQDRRNMPLGVALALSGHASVGQAMQYYRAGSSLSERAARLLDEPAEGPDA